MKILIWSDGSKYIKELTKKLRREHHEIYQIYNEKHKQTELFGSVHEEYYLEYRSSHILTVIQNTSPDVCMFMVEPLRMAEGNETYADYVAGLVNAVLSAKQAGVGTFIYRSSTRIYGENQEEIIYDDTVPERKGEIIEKLLSCEDLLLCHGSGEFRTIILRCGEIYSNEPTHKENNGMDMFVDSIARNAVVRYDAENYRTCLYIKDACEAVYRIILNLEEAGQFVLVAPDESASEEEIISCLHESVNFDTEKCTRQTESRRHQYESGFLQSLGYREHYPLAKGIAAIAGDIRPEKEELVFQKKSGKKWISILEIFIAFVLVQSFMLFTAEAEFHALIDIYMLFVLVIAVIYGGTQAFLASILCVLGRIFSGREALLLEGTQYYYWGLQLLIVTALGGFVKDKYKRKANDLEDEKEYLDYELEYYKQLNQNGQEIKNIYEKRLLNHENSFGKIAEIVSELDSLEPQKVFFEAVNVVARAMNSRGVCIYTLNETNGFARLLASVNKKVWNLGKSFSVNDYPEMMEKLRNGEVYINKEMAQDLPLMAKAVMDNGNIQGILMVYQMEFEEFNTQQTNTFAILTALVENSMRRAFEYYEVVKERRYYSETRIMKWQEFRKILELYCAGEDEKLLEYTLLEVAEFSGAVETLEKLVRDTDYLGEYGDGKYYVLLTNTAKEDSRIVMGRFRSKGIEAEIYPEKNGKTLEEVYPKLG